jgi:hypothetical protein
VEVGLGQRVCVESGVEEGASVLVGGRVRVGGEVNVMVGIFEEVAVITRVALGIGELVYVLLGVRVGQRVWVGLGRLRGVAVSTGVKGVVAVSDGIGVAVAGTGVGVSNGVPVSVCTGAAVRARKIFNWSKANTVLTASRAMIRKARAKYRHPVDMNLRRSGQLAWRRPICMERTPAL